jgi:hypothetical protein
MFHFKEANFSGSAWSKFYPEIFNTAIAMFALRSGWWPVSGKVLADRTK